MLSAAYRRSLSGIALSLFALTWNMFWFPVPATFNVRVSEFLEFEKAWLTNDWSFDKVALASTMPLTLLLLGYALWKRSLVMGIAVMVLMASGKVAWSIANAGAWVWQCSYRRWWGLPFALPLWS